MKFHYLAALLFIVTISAFGGQLKEEVDSDEEAFHRKVHESSETYLVCFYSIQKKPWLSDWEQLDIAATIVDIIAGPKKVGNKITFNRVLDGKYGDISGLSGALYYVHYQKSDAIPAIDPQDPHGIFSHSPALSDIANGHKAKQGAAVHP